MSSDSNTLAKADDQAREGGGGGRSARQAQGDPSPGVVGPLAGEGSATPWSGLIAGSWGARFWLRGFISAGGSLPASEFRRLWDGDDPLNP